MKKSVDTFIDATRLMSEPTNTHLIPLTTMTQARRRASVVRFEPHGDAIIAVARSYRAENVRVTRDHDDEILRKSVG